MFCHVRVLAVLELMAVMVMVMVEPSPATVAEIVPLFGVSLILLAAEPLPVTFTVTVALGLKVNPLGAFKMMVPFPMIPAVLSAAIGPVKVVHEPPVESAEMAEPPVAAVTLTWLAARAAPVRAKESRINSPRLKKLLVFGFIKTIREWVWSAGVRPVHSVLF